MTSMKSIQTQEKICGVVLGVVSGVLGFISTFSLAGLGICGFDLTKGMVCFALGSSAVLPAVNVRFMPAPWWVSGVVFCYCFPITIFFGILGQEWNRVIPALGCVGIAFGGAWLFRPFARKI